MTRTQGEAPRTDELADPGDPASDAVPRLPRGRGIRLSRPELVRVAGLAILLGFLLVTQRPCASAVSKFVTSFGDQGSAAAAMPRPGTIDPTGEDPRPAGRAVGGPTPHDTASPNDPTGEDPRPAGRAVGGPTPHDTASPNDPTGEDRHPAGRAVGGPTPHDTASPNDPTGEDLRPAGRAVGGPTGGDEPGLDGYEHLRPGMTDAQIKAVIDRARARARTGSASGGPR